VPFATRARSSFAITEAELKILYISQYFPPEMGAPAARVSELSQHWADAGHEVTVLTGFPNHPDGVVRPEYRRHFWHGVFREQWNGIDVVRTFLLPFPNRKAYERILNYSSFCASASLTASFLQRPDLVIATSPQLLVGLSGWWLSRLKKVPFVLEVRDLWPESLVGAGVGTQSSLLYRGIGRMAAFLYRSADAIAVVTPAFGDELARNWSVPREKIFLAPNGVETDLFSPANVDSRLTERLKKPGQFLVSFIGTMGLAHGLDTLLCAAEQLKTCAPEIAFLLVGEGADRERIIALAKSKNLSNVLLLPQQPREKIPAYIGASDACVVMLKESDVFETVIPTKMLEFMSCAKPLILAVRGQAKRVLEAASGGLCVEPENPQALCDAVLRLKEDSALCEELGHNGRNYIVRELSRKRTALEYLELLKEIAGEKASISAAAA
jgi:glycosyltransferase involved in cell wall biosynthesis